MQPDRIPLSPREIEEDFELPLRKGVAPKKVAAAKKEKKVNPREYLDEIDELEEEPE